MPYKCVTYSSFASAGLNPAEVDAIQRTSRRNNARDSITGVLMFNGAMFAQVIEGPDDAVDRLLMWIASDERHCTMQVRDERRLDQRIFADWSMGLVRLDGGWLEGQHDVVDALSRDMPEAVYEVLMEMASTLPFG